MEIPKSTFYRDSDNDKFGNKLVTISAATAPDGYVDNKLDCDDNNNLRNPDKEEICDGIDNDCDPITTETSCSCIIGTTQSCEKAEFGVCKGSINICVAGSWPACTQTEYGSNYEATESSCSDNLDNDCDGLTDCLDPNCLANPSGNADWDNDKLCDSKDTDKDGDGVPNTNDKEEWTPFGCVVNTFDPSLLGKQLNSDSDNICDGIDKCINTIPSCSVQGYNDLSPGCPANCEIDTCVADPACECKTCAECISGTFDFCSQAECSVCAQGACVFQPKDFAKDFCVACSSIDSCSEYLTQSDCTRNPCGSIKDKCTWSSNTCCIDNNKNGLCDNKECIPGWECGIWSSCTDTTIKQTRICTDKNQCGISCSDDEDCINERLCSECKPQWQYSGWSICTAQGMRTRTLRDVNICVHECPKEATPIGNNECKEEKGCGTCTPDWDCTSWLDCEDGIRTRTCEDKNTCGITCSANEEECIEDQLCTIDEDDESTCGDGTCNEEHDENQATCLTDCEPSNPCVVDGQCDPQFGEDEFNCAEDCAEDIPSDQEPANQTCGDGFCDQDEDIFCTEDCPTTRGGPSDIPSTEEEESKSKVWIFVVLAIILVLLIAAYFLFFKKPGTTNKTKFKPSFGSILPEAPKRPPLFGPKTEIRPPVNLPTRTQKPRKSMIDDELEKSIREAKKLIGK